jgi:D-beta-D-heptose 7-phosphate kinase/D-beta-D-heptose 1-phosphate adenosyltransferase
VSSNTGSRPDTKRIDRADLLLRREQLASAGQSLVFTNGCFDLLHPGHIYTLNQSAKLGHILVVGLNSDASVRRLKGTGRPVDNLDTRVANLTGIDAVDFIVVFEEDTPLSLIEQLKPDILVKGGDYIVDRIVGREIVETSGGKVVTVPFLEGHSTTARLSSRGRV